MTILLTGSSGKTSSRLAALLTPSHQILIASRSGASVNDIPAVKFDWNDPSTYTNPYSHPQAQKSPIKAIYLVTRTGSTDPIVEMKPFIDIARERGVKRFVLLSTIREDENTPGKGKVHKYLKELEVEKGVEWTVLRPTWFMGEFSSFYVSGGVDMRIFVLPKETRSVQNTLLASPQERYSRGAQGKWCTQNLAAAIVCGATKAHGPLPIYSRYLHKERSRSTATFQNQTACHSQLYQFSLSRLSCPPLCRIPAPSIHISLYFHFRQTHALTKPTNPPLPENFSELHHAPTIRDQSAIFSATRDGRISFISVSDIAAVASRALTDTRPHNCDYILVGPELLSYDQVAALFSEVLGREIKYVRVTEEQVAESYIRFEVPEDYARKLGGGEGLAAKGVFEVLNDVVEKVKGAKAVSLREFVEANKAVW